MIRAIAIALALAFAPVASAEELEIEPDEHGCYQVPDKCIVAVEGKWTNRPGQHRFASVLVGSCEGRVIVRQCVEGPNLGAVGGDRWAVAGFPGILRTSEYVCKTSWRVLPQPGRGSRRFPDYWTAYLAGIQRSDLPAPTGRWFIAWIGSLKPENDAICVAKHETWAADPPPFRN